MLFNSLDFLIFFPAVTLLYFIMPQKLKQMWLLVVSYYFYMCWNAKYALLILFSTAVTYASGLLLEKAKTGPWDDARKVRYKNLTVALSFTLNLAVRFYFKYFNFTLDTISGLFRAAHIELNLPVFDIVLPVGISFYTFQALSYTMDVYRGEIYAEKNFFRYALFVSFFPQLVAGPIERSKNLIRQLAVPKKFNFEAARDGALLMIWGFFLKVVLADRVAIFVDAVYADYQTYGGWYLIVGTLFFAVQVYCDFYGYSVIAMGAAEILGIHLMENFDAPYFSTTVAEYWRKWHISLTSWFKDYVYIPLGGSKKGIVRKHINKMAVFLVSGLWHGASFSYVAWGGLNGLYQVMGELLKPARDRLTAFLRLNRESFGHKLAKMACTLFLVDFSLIFFRADRFLDAIAIIRQIGTVNNPWILFDGSIYECGLDQKNFFVALVCIAILLFADYCKHKGIALRKEIAKQDYWFRWLVISASVCAILIFGIWGTEYNAAGFLYFQF